VVVSPLIALQRDQVAALLRGRRRRDQLQVRAAERGQAFDDLGAGDLES